MCRNRGFTLLEVLIALALLAILSAALYGTFFSLMRGREAATAGMESRRELRDTLDLLRRELTAAFYRNNFNDQTQRLHFIVEDRDFFGKPASILDFTTISAPREGDQPVSDQTEVRYLPIQKEGKIVLARQVKDSYQVMDSPPYPQMDDIEGFLVECSLDGASWVRSWNTSGALNQRLPKFIRVTIRVKEGEKTADFATVVTPRMQ